MEELQNKHTLSPDDPLAGNYGAESQIDELIQENIHLRNQLKKTKDENKDLAVKLRKSFNEVDKLEQYLKENREIYLLAIEAANLGIYDTDVEDKNLNLKENWLARLGYDPTSSKDRNITWESLIHPDDREKVMTEFQKEVHGNVDSLTLEYRLRAADGNYRWIIESSKIIRKDDQKGKQRIVGTHYDITARKNAEEVEREQRAFTDALSETSAVFNSTLNLKEVLNLILTSLDKVVPHEDSDIWLTDKTCKFVQSAIRRSKNGQVHSTSSSLISIDEIKVFQEIATHRKVIHIPDISPNACPIPSRDPNYKSCICSPLNFGNYLLGFLVLSSSKTNFYSPTQIQRLEVFTNQAAIAIRNAQLYSQAQEVAALEERQRLAREMHDVISQTLFSASIKAEALPHLMQNESQEEIILRLEELHRLTRGALAEMRTMLMELRPNTIINTEMSNLLHQLKEGLSGRTTAKIDLITEKGGLLPPEVQTAYFRIAQEAINNILKHSKADQITIVYKNQDNHVSLLIEDNGCGFNMENVANDRMGIKIMHERAESIDSTLEIISKSRKGTKILIVWKKP